MVLDERVDLPGAEDGDGEAREEQGPLDQLRLLHPEDVEVEDRQRQVHHHREEDLELVHLQVLDYLPPGGSRAAATGGVGTKAGRRREFGPGARGCPPPGLRKPRPRTGSFQSPLDVGYAGATANERTKPGEGARGLESPLCWVSVTLDRFSQKAWPMIRGFAREAS